MKKIVGFLTLLLLLTGCGTNKLLNTPTKRVEMFLEKYQSLDDDVLEQLDDTIREEVAFNSEQREIYKELMKKHYKDLTYEIKDEIIDGDSATVTVEIEVTDYSKTMSDANTYLEEHRDEFNNDKDEYDASLFTTYRLEQLKKVKDRVNYTLDLTLTKVDDEWKLDNLSNADQEKIHGMYNY